MRRCFTYIHISISHLRKPTASDLCSRQTIHTIPYILLWEENRLILCKIQPFQKFVCVCERKASQNLLVSWRSTAHELQACGIHCIVRGHSVQMRPLFAIVELKRRSRGCVVSVFGTLFILFLNVPCLIIWGSCPLSLTLLLTIADYSRCSESLGTSLAPNRIYTARTV